VALRGSLAGRKLARLEVEISRSFKEAIGGLDIKRRGRGVVSWNITRAVDADGGRC